MSLYNTLLLSNVQDFDPLTMPGVGKTKVSAMVLLGNVLEQHHTYFAQVNGSKTLPSFKSYQVI